MAVTIRDVAKQAGVAPITVSRVVNKSGYVSEETRARVEAAIAELGYVPNIIARSLRSRETRTLALILTDVTNPFWTTLARGVEDAASENGFSVIFCNTDESEDEQSRYLKVVLEKRVDGLLLVPAGESSDQVEFVRSQGVPLVLLDRRVPGVAVDSVRSDSEGAAYQLVRLLTSLGHRRIAILSGPATVSTAADRVAGYRRALVEAGVEPGQHLVYEGAFSVDSGYEMARQALVALPRPTAFFAANNFIAAGALRALRAAGLNVPDDVALVAFDDLPDSLVVEPFLTVAAQRAYEMGWRATELLLARLAGTAPQEYQDVILPTELIVRHSSGGEVADSSALHTGV